MIRPSLLVSFLLCCTLPLLASCEQRQQKLPSCNPRVITTETTLDGPIVQTEWVDSSLSGDVVFIRTTKHSIYRSDDGGKTVLIQSDLPENSISKIYPTSSEKNIFFKVKGSLKSFWVSSDMGDHYVERTLPFIPIQFYPHPTNPDWILSLSRTPRCTSQSAEGVCRTDLWLSKDFGSTWDSIKQYVRQASWGSAGMGDVPEANIFVTTWKNPTGNQQTLDEFSMTFQRSTDFFQTTQYSLDHFIVFLYYRGTVFLVKRDSENPSAGLELHVSINEGVDFNQAVFPNGADLNERRYTILDISEHAAFVNVDHSTNGRWGYLYGSNSFDTDFSLSLKYNARNYFGAVDFHRVKGIDGVFIANRFLDPSDSTNLETVISFDKGGRWEALPLPSDVSKNCTDDQSCALQLYGATEIGSHSDIYSVNNATGLILSAGSIGPWLSTARDDIGLYFTRDAGLSWDQVRRGEYVFEFADQGAITVAANADDITTTLLYSWNEGLNWTECTFGAEGVEVVDIDTEPSSTGRAFILHGTRDDMGVVIHVDFNNFHERQCTDDDYETWSPSDHRGGSCLLGQKYTYTRRKRAAACFNVKVENRPTYVSQCNCTAEDYECDFCFVRSGDDGLCVLDTEECGNYNPYAAPAVCDGDWQQTQGYRPVSGDMCRATNYSRNTFDAIPRVCEGTDGTHVGDGDGDGASGNTGAYVALMVGGLALLCLMGVGIGAVGVLVLAARNESVRDTLKNMLDSPLSTIQYGRVGDIEPETLLGGLEEDDEDQFFDQDDAKTGLSDSDGEFDPRSV